MQVALCFNAKPESETFSEEVPPFQNFPRQHSQKLQDTYAEWDTWETIDAVKEALQLNHTVTLIEADEQAYETFKETKPDIVFNISEGLNGMSREAQIPAILDMLKIPYTGSDPLTLTTCLDKARTKEVLTYYKIPNPKFLLAKDLSFVKTNHFSYPLMVKPVCEGSSKGIFSSSFVTNKNSLISEVERILINYQQPALIEEFLPGKEFTVALIGNGEDTEVLPVVELNYNDFPENFVPIYSYEAKWVLDTKENPLDVFTCPANISSELEEKIRATALQCYNTLRCKDWSRIDIRLDKNGKPNIIEVNPLPGILPNPEENSCFPKAARTAGMNYQEMINKVLYVSAKRHNLI